MKKALKAIVFCLIAVSAMLLWENVRTSSLENQVPEITYTQFMSDVNSGKVKSVDIIGSKIRGHYRGDSGTFHLTGPSDPRVYLATLHERAVQVLVRGAASPWVPLQLLGTWGPLILLAVLVFVMLEKMRERRRPTPPSSSTNAPTNLG